MKYNFDNNTINFFTLVKSKPISNNLINQCIYSWSKVPNSKIYLFTMQDIIDTFPGLVDNDIYYNTMNDKYLGSGKTKYRQISKYHKDTGILSFENTKDILELRECSYSTDSLRLRLLQEIPNAVYADSDVYLFNANEFLDEYSSKDSFKASNFWNFAFTVCKSKSDFINYAIDFYTNELKDHIVLDSDVITAFVDKYFLDYQYTNGTDLIPFVNLKSNQKAYCSHLWINKHCQIYKDYNFDHKQVYIITYINEHSLWLDKNLCKQINDKLDKIIAKIKDSILIIDVSIRLSYSSNFGKSLIHGYNQTSNNYLFLLDSLSIIYNDYSQIDATNHVLNMINNVYDINLESKNVTIIDL